jgi:hypothetical protein
MTRRILVPLERLLSRGYAVDVRLGARLAGEARVAAHRLIGHLSLLVEDGDEWVVLVKRSRR